jgi:hypothetical protein
MTADLTAHPEWGVRFRGSIHRVSHVDPYPSEAGARKFLHALDYMGNTDAVLVHWDGAAWVPVAVTHG